MKAPARCLVPPLLLQPLVENAVRHGVASMVEGGTIDIAATLARSTCCASSSTTPPIPTAPTSRGEGIGTARTRAAA